jgi:thiol-disulfide isomerase/thioredoxin
MAKKKGKDLQQRLLALAGLVVIVGVVVVVLLVAGVLGGQGGGTTESGVKIENALVLAPPASAGQEGLEVAPKEGALAPDFELSDFDGTRHRLSDYRGTPVYVNFWATWCVPCQVELPDMQELHDRHGDDLTIIAVNRAEPLDRAKAYFNNIEDLNGDPGIGFTVDGLDPDDTLYDEYRALGMPVSVFIDAEGVVVRVYNGLIDLATMEESYAAAVDSSSGEMASDEGSGYID